MRLERPTRRALATRQRYKGHGPSELLARVSGLSSLGTQQERKTSSLARLWGLSEAL